METALFTELKTNPTLAGLLVVDPEAVTPAYHIYPLRLPDAFPSSAQYAIAYTQISEERIYPDLKVTKFQISCFARSFEKAITLSNAVEACLNYLSADKLGGTKNTTFVWVVGKQSLYDSVSKLYYYTVDISFKY